MGSLKKRFNSIIFVWVFTLSSPFAFSQTQTDLAKDLESLDSKQAREYQEISDNLRCPTCTGLSVMQSDAPFSLQIRKAVLDQVKLGKNRDDIMKFFTERYGLWILREPPSQGFHLFAWLIPMLVLLGGPLALWYFFWRKRIKVNTYGVRSKDDILDEFEQRIQKMAASISTNGKDL